MSLVVASSGAEDAGARADLAFSNRGEAGLALRGSLMGLICGDGEHGTLEEPDITSGVVTGAVMEPDITSGVVTGAVMEPDSRSAVVTGSRPRAGAVTEPERTGAAVARSGPVDGAVTEPAYVEESRADPSGMRRGEPGVADRCKVSGAVCMVMGAVMEPEDETMLLPNGRTIAGVIAARKGCTVVL